MIFESSLDIGQRPIRSELFSLDRLEGHARSLAKAQAVGRASPDETPLPQRLRVNTRALTTNYIALAKTAKAGQSITSAGEWFLDNFHIVEEQARQIQRDLPASFYRELPKLREGHLRGYPRVYGIAWALVSHSDSALDLERIERFVEAYQQVAPLRIGELWAIAITLRLVLVENLRRLTDDVVRRVVDAERGKKLASELLAQPEENQAQAIARLDMSPATLASLEHRLRDEGAGGDAILHILEESLHGEHSSSQAMVQQEYQAQSADDVSVRNVINAMRLVSNLDWADFFEHVSLVDRALAGGTNFKELDFPTRDRYRRAVERFARRSRMNESGVATCAAQLAMAADPQRPYSRDIGYYLIGGGRAELETQVGYSPGTREGLARFVAGVGLAGYVGAIIGLAAALLVLLLWLVARFGADTGLLPLLAFVAAVPASDLATALVNRLVTRQPEILPSLGLKDGVPGPFSTILVVPTLLDVEDTIRDQVERLEVHYLANGDAGMQFVLLSDWNDSDVEEAPEDRKRLEFAMDHIAELNRRYAGGGPLFLLLHRERRWNPAQGRWMGWERKRGKLHELNRLLRGARDTSFINADQALSQLRKNVQFVITLDADTRLPRGAARRLIGKMAHPLNRPQFDSKTGCVVSGHGIMQPRVTPSLPIGSESSLFQWAFSGPNGLDPYAFAVSDVYQDLFDEGSFVGKGIYDVDAFERAMDARIPENTILSHDLLEGSLTRAALVSDVEVVEEFPRATKSKCRASIAGRAEIGSCCPGYSGAGAAARRICACPMCRRWGAGRCWTICAARSPRRRCCFRS